MICFFIFIAYGFNCTFSHQLNHLEVTHSGEKHGEDVDWSLQQVVASNGDGHRRDEHQVAETEQEGGEELEAVRIGFGVVGAAPTIPAY